MSNIWRNVTDIFPHPDNGQMRGGARVSTMFVRLDCKHTRTYPKSKCPSGKHKVQCLECETQEIPQPRPRGFGRR